VAIVQRFGGALNHNVPLHPLVLDGAFAGDGSVVAFHPMRRLTREDVAGVVALIARRVERRLERRGLAGREPRQAVPGQCVSVGRVDAANVWARCPGVSALRRAAAPRGAD
jgi:putative transposase